MTTTAPAKQPRDSKGRLQRRISPQIREAIRLMIWEGLPPTQAAQQANVKPHTLQEAIRRPHVVEAMKTEASKLLHGAAPRAVARMDYLAHHAKSEAVQRKAAEWVAGVAGIAPAQNVNINAQVSHSFAGIGFGQTIEGESVADNGQGDEKG